MGVMRKKLAQVEATAPVQDAFDKMPGMREAINQAKTTGQKVRLKIGEHTYEVSPDGVVDQLDQPGWWKNGLKAAAIFGGAGLGLSALTGTGLFEPSFFADVPGVSGPIPGMATADPLGTVGPMASSAGAGVGAGVGGGANAGTAAASTATSAANVGKQAGDIVRKTALDPGLLNLLAILGGTAINAAANSRGEDPTRERVPFANVEGEWRSLQDTIRGLLTQKIGEMNQPIDLPHTGVPELPDGRGRKVPDYLKPSAQGWGTLRSQLQPGAIASLMNGGNGTAQMSDALAGVPAAPGADSGLGSGGVGDVQAMLSKILSGDDLGNSMASAQSPSRISSVMANETLPSLTRRKPTISPQTYGAATLMLHALTGDANNPFGGLGMV